MGFQLSQIDIDNLVTAQEHVIERVLSYIFGMVLNLLLNLYFISWRNIKKKKSKEHIQVNIIKRDHHQQWAQQFNLDN
jgi:hypothetical protein